MPHLAVVEKSSLNTRVAADAVVLGRRIADLLRTDAVLTEAVTRSVRQSKQPWGWNDASLANGRSGLALVHAAAADAAPDPGSRSASTEAAVAELRRASVSTRTMPLLHAGLFGGTAGLATAVRMVARLEPRLAPNLTKIDDDLAEQLMDPAGEEAAGLFAEDYDVISGAAGVVSYLSSVPAPSSAVVRALGAATDGLAQLCESSPSGAWDAWVIKPAQYPMEHYRQEFPHGYVNLGLAHGVPGILLGLTEAYRAGLSSSRVRSAIDRCLSFLLDQAVASSWGTGAAVDEQGVTVVPGDVDRCHIAWCYGGPGVSVALLRAAEALDDPHLREQAIGAFDAALERYLAGPGAISATLCHGHAGVVLIADLFARGGSAAAAAALTPLVEKLIAYTDDQALLLVRDQEVPGNFVDDPSLLTGAAGVALTLSHVGSGNHDPALTLPFLGW